MGSAIVVGNQPALSESRSGRQPPDLRRAFSICPVFIVFQKKILAHMGHKVKQIIVPLEINVLYHVLTLEPT